MSKKQFVNRNAELKQLDTWFGSERPELIVVYGRRRIGKTRLLVRACEGRKKLFFSSPRTSGKEALALFSERIAAAFPGRNLESVQFVSFRKALEFLFQESRISPLILVLDEFPYLLESEPGIDTHIQHLWDHKGAEAKIKIVICGSTLSVMQRKVLGKNAPLYGRRTGSMHLPPFPFSDAKSFAPDIDIETAVYYYAILGGVPFYLEQIGEKKSVAQNVTDLVLCSNGLLYNEPYFLVQEELRDPKLYFAVMHAIASGHTRPTAIAGQAGLDSNRIGKYLNTLMRLALISREMPITVKPSARLTKGYYRIEDPFLRFWFRYVYPNSSAIELGNGLPLWKDTIRSDMPTFIGAVWEAICRQYLAKHGAFRFGMKSPLMRIGRYWGADFEIDIVAENGAAREVLFCECKWTKRPDLQKLLTDLKLKSDSIAEYRGFKKYYSVFSRGKALPPELHVSAGEM